MKLFIWIYITMTFIIIPTHFSFATETDQQYSINTVERLARIEEGQKAILSEMHVRFEASDKRFEAILSEMKTRFEAADKRFEAMQSEMKTRFEAADKRFEAMQSEMKTRFESADKRFEAMQSEMKARFESADKRFETRFEALQTEMKTRFESVDRRFEAIDRRFEDLIRAINQRFESVDKRIDQLSNYMMTMIGTLVSLFLAGIGYSIWDRRTVLKKSQENATALIIDHKKQNHLPSLNIQEKINQIIHVMTQMSEKFPEMRQMMQTAQLM